MDDSRSDDTDELLTTIDPLIFQSECIVSAKDYVENMWIGQPYGETRTSHRPTIVDDILSSRSLGSYGLSHKATDSLFKTPLPLLMTNISAHNSALHDEVLDTARTASTHFYEASASAQSTPRTTAYKAQRTSLNSTSVDGDFLNERADDNFSRRSGGADGGPATQLRRDHDLSQRELGHTPESRTEMQRMRLTNKQLSSQLQEAKLAIQTLTVQLEQVQQECRHKEATLENLDSTLGRLVAGWKKRDCQKDEEIASLGGRVGRAAEQLGECQRQAEEARAAQASAGRALAAEKLRAEQLQKGLGLELDGLRGERAQLVRDNKELARRYVGLEAELRRLRELCALKNSGLEQARAQAGAEKAALERAAEQLRAGGDQARELAAGLALELQVRDDKVEQLRAEMRTLEDELHRTRGELMEKDACFNEGKARLRALADEHALALRKQEKELQVKLQQELGAALAGLGEQHKRALQAHSGGFQVKLNEQAKRHRLELERLRQVAELEISSRLADSQETVSMLRARLDRSEKSVQFWQQEKESVEKARNQISSRLYEIMRLGYRGAEQESGKQTTDSAMNLPYTPASKLTSQSGNGFNLAGIQVSHFTTPNHYFEPIKLDSKCLISTPTAKSLTSDIPVTKNQNPSMVSSVNTAVSY